ncbi:uncharacterized protein LOC134254278 [Saccostrea cucullata]|uniref:uncharacterized protein LOC134254278 n=1 Tax=Saccostrea cuccullata TaxID=36930 RepID=UPI002ED0563A
MYLSAKHSAIKQRFQYLIQESFSLDILKSMLEWDTIWLINDINMDYSRRAELFEILYINTNIEYTLPPSLMKAAEEPILKVHGGPECSCDQRISHCHTQNVLDQDLFHLIDSLSPAEENTFAEEFDNVSDVIDFLCDCEVTEVENFSNVQPINNDEDVNQTILVEPVNGPEKKQTHQRKRKRDFEEVFEVSVKRLRSGVCSSGFSYLCRLSPGNNIRSL